VVSVVASYLIIFIFQNIRSHTKLFLLIAVLLLLYAVGKQQHLSSLLIILIFGLIIANMKLFFRGRLGKWLHLERAEQIYEDLHLITMETAFVVRTFFFVIFGITISLASLANLDVALISGLIILSIYAIRWVILRIFIGKDILPQLFIAPRGLITILLFYNIPTEAQVPGFEPGILLFIIIGTSVLMTLALISDKRRTGQAVRKAQEKPIGFEKWKAPTINEVVEEKG
ncbi:MAG: sodium:proton exchanger, partial [Lewinella sp.]|nr:sodium:proton exchanger [Lewinella sp.]